MVEFEYDLAIIGGGSGGLAAASKAASYGAKVLIFDYVDPTPRGITWGVGGTCVNVGCVPKKLFHRAAVMKHDMEASAEAYGLGVHEPTLDWPTLQGNVTMHIRSVNFGYRMKFTRESITYKNERAKFIDAHTLEGTDREGNKATYTADKVLVAVGCRPKYSGVPGEKELCITSDDLFKITEAPGTVLVVGASYVALECAGFLKELGFPVTVMIRSIPLRGFDREFAEAVVTDLEKRGILFIRGMTPKSYEKVTSDKEEEPKEQVKVHFGPSASSEPDAEGVFDNVLVAIGRTPLTSSIGLDKVGVTVHERSKKILTDDYEKTCVDNIYAIGDCRHGVLELTPVAIRAGHVVSENLFSRIPMGKELLKVDYKDISTTVFTPLEYSSVGLSEEAAIAKYGEDKVEVFRTQFTPLEHTVPHLDEVSTVKIVVMRTDESIPFEKSKIVGLHYSGINAGEIMQGYGVSIRRGITKDQLDETIGIHPTTAEGLLDATMAGRVGGSFSKTSC
ncbi:Thioredoxin reductase SEP1 [Aduncisulcus paluster]|uniref:thioredoxin-disulfide reductase (NADPH) n=1 Tax=Aduncisulcus paluster TaxID=2918883 RepID=A0ABQ5KGB3_9EUKA|nr:Thioredoxin reductase SEP1 [Aduncisulcus paluster]|eukprot:gnl/Carplike_NY0171/211_a306_4613.p1 GENE.gnl/Carplike_NY0171/211_a306_4613~~gnl/Carplike_NY0171/211_a306_4613.p1  ORF type:complete len:506 (+),score=176.84 gnl/Carplike_NY0171/211_a306_4613:88-1605(+)